MTEIQRSFDSQTSEKKIKMSENEIVEKLKKEEEPLNDLSLASLPSYQSIFEFDLLLLVKEMNDNYLCHEIQCEVEEKKIETFSTDEKRHSFLNTACKELILKNLESACYDNENERILKDCMILQGGFDAILTALSKTRGEVQLELLSTLINLLANNSKNQSEFK